MPRAPARTQREGSQEGPKIGRGISFAPFRPLFVAAEAQKKVTLAKADAEVQRQMAKAHAEQQRAETAGVTPMQVMMHAYDALGALGGTGTTIVLGDWAHVPSFLFPRVPSLQNAFSLPFVPMAPSAAAQNPYVEPRTRDSSSR